MNKYNLRKKIVLLNVIKYYTVLNYARIIGMIRGDKRTRSCYPAMLKFRYQCVNTAKT